MKIWGMTFMDLYLEDYPYGVIVEGLEKTNLPYLPHLCLKFL